MYLSKAQIKGFKNYKYSCSDTSPLSIYVAKPLWNRIVNRIPEWVAPNLLTVFGFICTLLQYAILASYDGTFNAQSSARIKAQENSDSAFQSIGNSDSSFQAALDNPDSGMNQEIQINAARSVGLPGEEIPSFVWFTCAILQALSYAADGCDGVQARKCGTSTMLGEMMDHTIDAWTASFTMMAIYSLIGANEMYSRGVTMVDMFLFMFCLFFSFFSAHWEKMTTGTLVLPWTYDLSQVLLILLFAFTGMVGSNYWTRYLFTFFGHGVTYLIAFRTALYIGTVLNLLNDTRKIWIRVRNGSSLASKKDLIIAWLSPLLFMALYAIWIFAGPFNRSVNLYHPRMVFLGVGALFANIMNRFMLCGMSKTKVWPKINPGIYVVAIFLILDQFVIHHAYITTILWPICSILLILMHLHYMYVVSLKLAQLKNHYVFSVRKRKKNGSGSSAYLNTSHEDMDNLLDSSDSESSFDAVDLEEQRGGSKVHGRGGRSGYHTTTTSTTHDQDSDISQFTDDLTGNYSRK